MSRMMRALLIGLALLAGGAFIALVHKHTGESSTAAGGALLLVLLVFSAIAPDDLKYGQPRHRDR